MTAELDEIIMQLYNYNRKRELVINRLLKFEAKVQGNLVYDVYHIQNAATVELGDERIRKLIATFRSDEFDTMHKFIADYLTRVYGNYWKRDKDATGIHGSLYRLTLGSKEHPIEVDDRIRNDDEVVTYGMQTPA